MIAGPVVVAALATIAACHDPDSATGPGPTLNAPAASCAGVFVFKTG